MYEFVLYSCIFSGSMAQDGRYKMRARSRTCKSKHSSWFDAVCSLFILEEGRKKTPIVSFFSKVIFLYIENKFISINFSREGNHQIRSISNHMKEKIKNYVSHNDPHDIFSG